MEFKVELNIVHSEKLKKREKSCGELSRQVVEGFDTKVCELYHTSLHTSCNCGWVKC